MKPRAGSCSVTLVLFLTLIACSSDDAPGTGGEGPAGATGGSGGGRGGGGGAGAAGGSTSGSGGVSPDACSKLCDRFEELGCENVPTQCQSACDTWVERAGDCGYQMLAEIDCIAESTEQCGQDVCQAEFAALDSCARGVDCFTNSSTGDGSAGDYSCAGAQGCSTGQVRMDCVRVDGGPIDCECFIGGAAVGTCVNDIENCQVDFNCCARFW
ncbi:MAG: hypothetical protein WKG00_19825 [Polyangiaceae bacterium]